MDSGVKILPDGIRTGAPPLLIKRSGNYDKFITTWKTNNAGVTGSTSIGIPTTGSGYDCRIFWGDGTVTIHQGTPGRIDHDYRNAGTYQVKIEGTFPRIYFNNSGDKLKILSIDNWGFIKWTSMASAFYGCGLNGTYTDSPDLSICTDLSNMFNGCSGFNWTLNTFNAPVATTASQMIYGCTIFNQSLRGMKLPKVTTVASMLMGCIAFNNAVDINMPSVTNMSAMLRYDVAFNDSSVNNWNLTNVQNLNVLFYGCVNFNQSLSNWNITNVTDISGLFISCSKFNQSLSNFNTAKCITMLQMFDGCTDFNQSVSNFNTSLVTNMSNMFKNCTAFNQDISNFNTIKVTDMSNMFLNCTSFKQSLAAFVQNGITAGSGMIDLLKGCDINATGTTTNYDNTLISWAATTTKNTITFNGGNSKYSVANGQAPRDHLTVTHSWTITDGGT